MAIEILPYNPTWPDEFQRIGAILRQVLGDQALRINHIGSTSVPGLAAKDIIDVQISVAALTPPIEAAMFDHGFTRRVNIDHDHQPPSMTTDPANGLNGSFMSRLVIAPATCTCGSKGAPISAMPCSFVIIYGRTHWRPKPMLKLKLLWPPVMPTTLLTTTMSKTPFATLLWLARKAGRNSVNGRCRRLMPKPTAPTQKG